MMGLSEDPPLRPSRKGVKRTKSANQVTFCLSSTARAKITLPGRSTNPRTDSSPRATLDSTTREGTAFVIFSLVARCSFARLLVCSLLVCSFARLLVCSFARLLVCSFARLIRFPRPCFVLPYCYLVVLPSAFLTTRVANARSARELRSRAARSRVRAPIAGRCIQDAAPL
jgi:hypothetical protein